MEGELGVRKRNSTNFQNETMILTDCPIYNSTRLIAARWRTHILWFLRNGPLRFSEVKRSIPLATERMIALRLNDLVVDGLVEKTSEPASARYRLTRNGKKLVPVLEQLLSLKLDR